MVDWGEEPPFRRSLTLITSPQALSVSVEPVLPLVVAARLQEQQYWLLEEESQHHPQTNQAAEPS
jgi:hypothetical protein